MKTPMAYSAPRNKTDINKINICSKAETAILLFLFVSLSVKNQAIPMQIVNSISIVPNTKG